MPAVSVGNVGQLAVDALVATKVLGFEHIGYLNDEDVLPVSGNLQGRICVPLEVYYSKQQHLLAIQQRSSIVPSQRRQFAARLAAWALAFQVRRVVLLSSCHAFRR